MSRIDTHAFGLWWKLAKGWFSTKFASISVDLTPVEDKLDEVKEAVDGVAQEATLGDVAEVLDYIEQGGMPSITAIAKQGSNANANISTIQEKIGTPASGQQPTLFGAIANINIDTSTLAKQGTNPNATLSEVQRIVEGMGADQQAVRDCYAIAQEKGLTIPSPSDQTLQNLPATMETIVAAYQNRLYVNASATVIANTLEQEVASCEGVIFVGSLKNLLESKTYLREVYNIIAPAPTSLETLCGSSNSSPNLQMVDCRRISGNTSPSLYTAFQNTHIEDLVGWETIESVIANGTKIFDGYNADITIYGWHARLNRASLRALINGLADRTGMEAKTLACGPGFANLTADDIQVATDKNWNVTQ